MEQKFFKYFLFLFFVMLIPINSIAQKLKSAQDYYKEGKDHEKNGRYIDAINSYDASRQMDNSFEAKCNARIKECKKKSNSGKGDNKDKKDDRKGEKEKKTPTVSDLEIKPYTQFQFPASRSSSSQKLTIKSKPDWPDWDYRVEGNSNWLHVERGSGQEETSLIVWCDNNTDVQQRTAQIVVTTPRNKPAVLSKTIYITQNAGVSVKFNIDGETSYEVKRNHKYSVVVKIRSNSLIKYPENKNKNWQIVSMPKWCQLTDLKKTSKGNVPVESNELAVDIIANDEGRVREGDIRIESQGLYQTIHIKQKK